MDYEFPDLVEDMAVEWTTQSDEETGRRPTATATTASPRHPASRRRTCPMRALAPRSPSAPPPVPTPRHPARRHPAGPAGFEQCPSCGALVAVDQRYCLECGHRRGDPRLPFMDAVVFMDAMNRPPETASASTKGKKRGISPNAALIAGVGTLLLALGIGVLIGRSGNHTSAPREPGADRDQRRRRRRRSGENGVGGGEATIGGGGSNGKRRKPSSNRRRRKRKAARAPKKSSSR